MNEEQLKTIINEAFNAQERRITANIDTKLAAQEERITANLGAQIEKLFHHTEKQFAEIEAELATKASAEQAERILNNQDAEVKRLDIDESERAAMNNQLGRHEGWIDQLAEHAGTRLTPKLER